MKQKSISVDFSNKFKKQLQKAPVEIKRAFSKRLDLFNEDIYDSQLRNHQLSGNYRRYRSINITGDWRAIYSQKGMTILFELLGTHSQLYK